MPKRRKQHRAVECANCGGDLLDGACAFCPSELDDDRDQEFAELDSYFQPGRTP